MQSQDVLSATLWVWREFSPERTSQDRLKGKMLIDDTSLPRLISIGKHCQHVEYFVNDRSVHPNQLDKHKGTLVEFEFTPPSDQWFWSLADLMAIDKYRVEEPDRYYIQDLDYASDETTTHEAIRRYRDSAGFAAMLREHCDHWVAPALCILIRDEKLEFPVRYSTNDTRELPLLTSLGDQLTGHDHHRPQRIETFKGALIECLRGVARERRFAYLLAHFEEVYQRYQKNYQFYLKDFSVEKKLDEFRVQKVALIERLDKVLGDIQTKILAVPFSYIIIAGQIKETADTKNGVIMVTTFILLILVYVFLFVQGQSLIGVSRDVSGLRSSLEKNSIAHLVQSELDGLKRKKDHQFYWLSAVALLVLAVFFATGFLYCESTSELNLVGCHFCKLY